MKCTNINFVKVLQNISKAYIKASPDDKEVWIESFNRMCDDLLDIDFFGTEGQNDPRGDQRS